MSDRITITLANGISKTFPVSGVTTETYHGPVESYGISGPGVLSRVILEVEQVSRMYLGRFSAVLHRAGVETSGRAELISWQRTDGQPGHGEVDFRPDRWADFNA